MSPRVVLALLRKEVRDARRNRWFLMAAALFALLSVSLSVMGFIGLGSVKVSGFGRTAASLSNLVVLVVPLMALLLGAASIVSEREHGTLESLLAQPVTPGEVVLGKYLGSAVALVSAIVLGFGATALIISRYAGSGEITAYLILVLCTILLGLVFLGAGFLISVFARRHATAIGAAMAVWVGTLVLSDLGLMGTAVVLKLPAPALLWLAVINPAQSFNVAVVGTLHRTPEIFGAVGLYASETFGPWLTVILLGLLSAWILGQLFLAMWGLAKRGVN